MGRNGCCRVRRGAGGLVGRRQGKGEEEGPEEVRYLWSIQTGPLSQLSGRDHHMDRIVPDMLRGLLHRMAMGNCRHRIHRDHLCDVQRCTKARTPSDPDIRQRPGIPGIHPHHPAPAAVRSDILPRKTQMVAGIGPASLARNLLRISGLQKPRAARREHEVRITCWQSMI